MKKILLEVIVLTMALLLLGGCSGKEETEAALTEEKAALEVAISTLEYDELKSREAIGEVVDQIALLKTQLEEVHRFLDALKSEEILLMEDTGTTVADISEFPAVITDGHEGMIQGISRYMESYTYQYNSSNYPDDVEMDGLVALAMKASDLYEFLEGGFMSAVGDEVSDVPLPWALVDASNYGNPNTLIEHLLELYTPNDVKVFLDRYFTTDPVAIEMPFHIHDGQIYYNPTIVEGDRVLRQAADEAGVKWQRVTETELTLTLIYPVTISDKQGLRTEIIEESYTFYKTGADWQLSPNVGQGPYIWSADDDVWLDEAHSVTIDQVNRWVLALDATLSDYPNQSFIYNRFYQDAHIVSYGSQAFDSIDNDVSWFDVLVFNGDKGLMNLEVGEGIGHYLKTDTTTDTLLYGLGPTTYVVQKHLAEGGVSYEEYTYDYLTSDIENYIYNFIERKRAGVIALIAYGENKEMRSADFYYMDQEGRIIRINYDQERLYRVFNDVSVNTGYKGVSGH